MNLLNSIQKLNGIGPKTETYFNKLHIFTYQNLLTYFPRTYEYFSIPSPLNNASIGNHISIRGTIVSIENIYRNSKSITIIKGFTDTKEEFLCVFFHMPFLKKTIKTNSIIIISGVLLKKENKYQFISPELFSLEKYAEIQDSFQPVYSLTKGINNKKIKKAILQILTADDFYYPDFLPTIIRKRENLYPLKDAICEIHFPKSKASLDEAKRRLVFDDFFLYFFKLQQLKNENSVHLNTTPMIKIAETNRFIEALPYTLTLDQKTAWLDIQNDLSGNYQMNRLIQGDVGSGKTILAVLAILMCIGNNYQSAFMAPLEILAQQHYETITTLIKNQHIKNAHPCLLTGSVTKTAKEKIYNDIQNGRVNIIIGTHALLQDQVIFKNLGLVITDEQHRFGVKQRESLSGKGAFTNTLVMSATPIPRSLAIVLYGDLNVSKITMLPEGRLPIKNSVIGSAYRKKAYSFILKQVEQNHQVYIICPMVESSKETNQLHNVIDYTNSLRKTLPEHIQIASIHGKLKPKEKMAIMDDFKQHRIDILVATTVIEVGINVPNATVMLIENAERFGLATLHQLRGRIGRGEDQSYCMFLCETESTKAMERLNILLHSNDGFKIANEDLKLRGPGNLLGIQQSGALQFSIGDIYENSNELTTASFIIDQIFNNNISLTKEEKNDINEHIQNNIKYETYENIL